MQVKKGFTLVELLVVIAIIALLISILAPSLTTVKTLTKKLLCQTNIHGLAQGMNAYAGSNKDRVPPFYSGGAETIQIPAELCLAYDKGSTDANGRALPYNLAIVGEGGYFKWEMCFCPLATHNTFKLSGYELPLGKLIYGPGTDNTKPGITEPGLPRSYAYTGYSRNEQLAPLSATNYWNFKYKIASFSALPSDRPILIEPFWNVGFMNHLPEKGWSAAYADTHAECKVSTKAYDTLEAMGGAADTFDEYDVAMKAYMKTSN